MYLCGDVNQAEQSQERNFSSSKPPIHVPESTTPMPLLGYKIETNSASKYFRAPLNMARWIKGISLLAAMLIALACTHAWSQQNPKRLIMKDGTYQSATKWEVM